MIITSYPLRKRSMRRLFAIVLKIEKIKNKGEATVLLAEMFKGFAITALADLTRFFKKTSQKFAD